MSRPLSIVVLTAKLFLGWWLTALLLGSLLGGLDGFGVAVLGLSWVALAVALAGALLQVRDFRGFPQALQFGACHQAVIQVPMALDAVRKELAEILQEDLAATSLAMGGRRIQAVFQPPAWSGWWRKWTGSDELILDLQPLRGATPGAGGCSLAVRAHPLSRLFNGFFWVDRGRNYRRLRGLQEALGDRLAAETSRQEAARKSESLEGRLAHAELLLLRAQVEPHFLFNTLAHLRELVRRGENPLALEMLDHLISYARTVSDRIRQATHPLEQELAATRGYLHLIRLRFGDRIRFAIEAEPAAQECEVPVGVLLIPVENAVKHGLEPKGQGGCVEINGRVAAGLLHLEILDDGQGLQPALGPNRGTGLANLRERLQLSFAGEARMTVEDRSGGGVRVGIDLPARHREA